MKMPVQLNEPLNTLQRMCEELEYCELLDKAADTQDPFQRMVGGFSLRWYSLSAAAFVSSIGQVDAGDLALLFYTRQIFTSVIKG